MQKLDVINGLRGFAVLAVIYYHLFLPYTPSGFGAFDWQGITWLPLSFLANGRLGVNLFFVLSGFVLAYPYLLQHRQLRTKADYKNFYLRRAQRLLPLYYISVLVSILLVTNQHMSGYFLQEVFHLATITFPLTSEFWAPRQNFLLWSLGIEIHFSIVFPLLLLLVLRIGAGKTLIIASVLALSVRLLGSTMNFDIPDPYLNPVSDSLIGRLDDFVWGIFCCQLFLAEGTTRLWQRAPLLVFAAGTTLILISCMLWDYYLLGHVSGQLVPFIALPLNLGFAALILSLLSMRHSLLRWCFSNWPIQLAGVMCYSIYVWHGIAIIHFVTDLGTDRLVAFALLLTAFCCLSYRYIEFGHEPDTRKLFLIKPKPVARKNNH